jgi:hypothetical protein
MKKLTLAQLQDQIDELKLLVQQMQQAFTAIGIEMPWVTPQQAAQLSAYCYDRFLDEIERAEVKRATGQRSDLKYGEHYIDVSNPHLPNRSRSSYKIHYTKFIEVLNRPADKRLL